MVIGCPTVPTNLAPVRENSMLCYDPLVPELGGPECMVPPNPVIGGCACRKHTADRKQSFHECLQSRCGNQVQGYQCNDRAIVSLPPELCRSLLRSAGQIHRVLRQVVHHCVAGRGHSYTCCSVRQLSCQMWKFRRQDLQLSFSK